MPGHARVKKSKAWQPSVSRAPWLQCPSSSNSSDSSASRSEIVFALLVDALGASTGARGPRTTTCIQCPLYCSPNTCARLAKRCLLGPKQGGEWEEGRGVQGRKLTVNGQHFLVFASKMGGGREGNSTNGTNGQHLMAC
jgi:hypothetical protein